MLSLELSLEMYIPPSSEMQVSEYSTVNNVLLVKLLRLRLMELLLLASGYYSCFLEPMDDNSKS